MFLYFVSGTALGAILVWVLYFSARREIVKIEEEKQIIQQDKHIIIEFMHNLVETLGEDIQHENLYQKIVHTAIVSSNALSACLYQYTENDTLLSVASEGLFPPLKQTINPNDNQTRAEFIEQALKSESFDPGEGLIGSVAQSRQPILIQDVSSDPRVIKHSDPALKIHSLILAPILFRKSVLGVLAVANSVDGMPFNENDLSLVQSLAEQAGMAIHNFHLMNHMIEKKKLDFDLALASNVQGMLLPSDPEPSQHLQVNALYEPSQKVGGDLYHSFKINDHKYGFAIADVSGKGIPASILMAICQTHLSHYAHQFDSPAQVLKHLNAQLNKSIRPDMFITLTYIIIDTNAHTATIARAGHEKPLLLSNNEIQFPFAQGMALGMVPSEMFDSIIQDITVPFNKDDILLLYTDGITETTNKYNEEFGPQRLADELLKHKDLSPEKINKQLVNALIRFSSSTQADDDLTLLTIKAV